MSANFKEKTFLPPRILLVDDDDVLRNEFVECFGEFGIAEAANGQEALAYLKKPNEIDLAILDVRMSGMNGIELLERIKRVAPAVRVIIFTGYGSKDVAIEALRSKADDYIEKPLDIDSTRETIEKHLQAKKTQQYGPAIKDKIEHVKDFLSRNLHKKVTLKDAAAAVYLSPKYLSRIFAKFTKQGFNAYKLALMIEEAKKLLTQTAETVDQISDRLGYQNPESFIRQFKRSVRLTPTEFRKKVQKNKSPKRKK